LNYWISTSWFLDKINNLGKQVPFKTALPQSFARHCCSSKKQTCI